MPNGALSCWQTVPCGRKGTGQQVPLPISGLTAWQGLFDHGRLTAGQTVLIHGAAGGVGSIAVAARARSGSSKSIGTRLPLDRTPYSVSARDAFADLQTDPLRMPERLTWSST